MTDHRRAAGRLALAVLVLAALVAGVAAAVPALARTVLQQRIQSVLKDARVSIGPVRWFQRPAVLTVSDIVIESDGYRIASAGVSVDRRLKVTVAGLRVRIDRLPEGLSGPPPALAAPSRERPFFPNLVEARDFTIEFRLPQLKGDVRGSAEIDFRDLEVRSAHLEAASIKSGGLKVSSAALDLPGGGARGVLTAEKIRFEKFSVADLRGAVTWEETEITAEPSASWMRGTVEGRLRLETRHPFHYAADIEVREFDLNAFTESMKWKEKMSAEGTLAGRLSVQGDVTGIRSLEGRLDAGEAGGDLVIRDPNFLKYLAENTRQPMALVEAAFKEYHFDTGSVSVAKDRRDIRFKIGLSGAKGRRDFEIHLHDQL